MLITLKNITKTYQTGNFTIYALSQVNFTIRRGEFVAILGPSGSGKTTLLDILGCLSRPTEGDYRLDGDVISELSDHELATIRNRKIGFVFLSFHLLSQKTALENVQLPLLYAGIPFRKRRSRAQELLARVGLADRMHHHSNKLSGGQQQRVSIARALANEPDIVLADEPTGNLDSYSSQEIMSLFHELRDNGQTIIMITHDHNHAKHAQRCVFLTDGKILSLSHETIDHAPQ